MEWNGECRMSWAFASVTLWASTILLLSSETEKSAVLSLSVYNKCFFNAVNSIKLMSWCPCCRCLYTWLLEMVHCHGLTRTQTLTVHRLLGFSFQLCSQCIIAVHEQCSISLCHFLKRVIDWGLECRSRSILVNVYIIQYSSTAHCKYYHRMFQRID